MYFTEDIHKFHIKKTNINIRHMLNPSFSTQLQQLFVHAMLQAKKFIKGNFFNISNAWTDTEILDPDPIVLSDNVDDYIYPPLESYSPTPRDSYAPPSEINPAQRYGSKNQAWYI